MYSVLLKLLHYLKEINFFTTFGDEIKFDENGDPAAMYDLVNWQLNPRGEMEFVTIGTFDETTVVGKHNLQLQYDNIVWNGNLTEVRISSLFCYTCVCDSIFNVNAFLCANLSSVCFHGVCLGTLVSMQQHLSPRHPESNQTQLPYLLP